MMINDVIRDAATEHEIYFLLAAYIEAVRYCDKPDHLPEIMGDLPLAGMDDVRLRTEKLKTGLGRPHPEPAGENRAMIKEAMDIFETALNRLQSLLDGKKRGQLQKAA